MEPVDLARWQFAITTVYHFLFVPITIGLSLVVAAMHTAWVRTRRPEWLRLAKFFGKLFTINFALGLVTGIVQEFQFGMNWSDYSRFVGDIFGAPLALEALLAFFVESTFLGLWIFGWGRIPEKLHAATMWVVHVGTLLSAYFILAANSFMQNPVGFRYNPDSGRAEMADFGAILTNKVQLVAFPHVITSAYMVGGAVVMGVGLWLWRRAAAPGAPDADDVPLYRKATRIGAVLTLVSSLGVVASGDIQGKIMTEVQPMKMAAAEALYENEAGAAFSILTIGSLDGTEEVFAIKVPKVLAFMATGDPNGVVEGINPIKARNAEMIAEIERTYGADVARISADADYTPNVPLAYWTFRLMMGVGFASMALSAFLLWVTRGSTRPPVSRWWLWAAIAAPLLPLAGNSFGWIFTETGRQPWVVNGLMTTAFGVSPSVSATEVLISMSVFTLLYAVLAVVEVRLFLRYVAQGAEPFHEPEQVSEAADTPLQFSY
ncbi:cytochrome BD ubiquinol oxidase subunit I [Knoellia sinensis KCTC 19936]|uniref:Cytochrome BD ubiquinol oxidase subunit I n=1 Tax=Knoellia sinensis KCTC 19936 TaxID=1385520 RepID=A0A0A0J3E1_9MICO|nr:cytochrome ubiquinol oxidase subunit I [Knoellia sinensis]KGN31688.1 cytochrome BD ubiquinol oxidase subunit I [Knoellia sinensis KCTC 19936]